MNLLIDPGMLPVNKLLGAFVEYSQENSVFLINKRAKSDGWKEVRTLFPAFEYKIFDSFEEKVQKEATISYSTAITSLLTDHRTILIAERVGKIEEWGSIHNAQKELEKIIFNIHGFLLERKIDCVLFQATPHGLYEWLLGKTAEAIGLNVLMIKTSPIPWRYWVVQGIDKQKPLELNRVKTPIEDVYLQKFIETNLLDYRKAIPDYEKERLENRKGKYWSWKNELEHFFKRPSPKLLKKIIYKNKLYRIYKDLCTFSFDRNSKNILFLMHYQPERTTLPEGKLYNQQWLLIRSLSMCLPEDWVLYVKEHPSTFTNTRFNPRYRDPQFYKDIASLERVQLVPLEADIFDLIDNSNGIATLTGTVGVQALIRGKGVLSFGHASYENAYGVVKIEGIKDLKESFNRFISLDKRIIQEEAKKYLSDVVSTSISHIDEEDTIDNNFSFYAASNRKEGHIMLLNRILSDSNLNTLLN